jgi:hypothetical protein
MLLDRYRELLTAYVDDELSDRQRRQIARLLRRSAEARLFLQQLQADAQALRHLPRPSLATDLTGPVLRTISESQLAPGQRRITQQAPSTWWMAPLASWAAAASVLFLLGIASYLYFAASLPQAAKSELTRKPSSSAEPSPQPELLGSPSVPNDPEQKGSRKPPRRTNETPSAVRLPHAVANRSEKPSGKDSDKPPPPPKEESALTDRLEMFQLDRVPDALPVVMKVRDLEQEPERKHLTAELGKDRDFRMELPCQNGSKAFERVQRAAQTLNIGLILDMQAQERLKLKWHTNYVLYFENVTPDEFVRFMNQIGIEDRKSAAGKASEVRIDRLVLTRMTAQHRKELSTLLGLDPTTNLPRSPEPSGIDPSKPLAELTARQLGQALGGQGVKPRPETGKPAAKTPETFALVLAYNPVRPSPGSDEIKRFLENRKPVRPGTIRVLLVLRS